MIAVGYIQPNQRAKPTLEPLAAFAVGLVAIQLGRMEQTLLLRRCMRKSLADHLAASVTLLAVGFCTVRYA